MHKVKPVFAFRVEKKVGGYSLLQELTPYKFL